MEVTKDFVTSTEMRSLKFLKGTGAKLQFQKVQQF